MSNDYHSAHTMGTGRGTMPGVGSQTPISFISILDNNIQKIVSDYQKVRRFVNDDYLVYIYRKWIGKDWYSFMLFQGARKRGRFSVEVGIGRRPDYPYFWDSALPDYSCDSVRERLAVSMEMKEDFYTYNSERDLESQLHKLLTNFIGSAVHQMLEERRDKVEVGLTMYSKVLDHARERMKETEERDPEKLFPDAFKIRECYDYYKKAIENRSYLGLFPREFIVNFADEEFILSAALIMSEMLNKPTVKDRALVKCKNPREYEDDLTYWLTGRVPPESYYEPLEDEDEQVKLYCYVKSVSMIEGLLGIESEKNKKTEEE